MRTRRRPLTIAHLIAVIAMIVPTGIVRGQPSEEGDDRVAVLQRLIFDVEARRRVLVRSRGSLIAISADQVGELFASQVLTDDMPPDSIVPRALRVREMSDVWLQELKRNLAVLEASRGVPAPRNVLLQWHGAPGSWSMTCQGRYPPQVQGKVDQVFMRRPPSQSRGLHVSLYRGHAFVTALNGTVLEDQARGEQRVEMPGDDFYPDVGTLVWDALVRETSLAADGVEGTIVASGALRYSGNDGSCSGTWHSP
jgi:hypothetical protein